MDKLKVFISGTQDDMESERNAAERAINHTLIAIGIRAETTTSQPQSPREWIEEQVRLCDIYLGIYSHRYGWIIPQEDKSATEFEYDLAIELGKPRLIWVRDLQVHEKSDPDFDRQEKFLKRVSDFTTGLLRQTFDTPAVLESKVAEGLGEALTKMARGDYHPIPRPKLLKREIPAWFQDTFLENINESSESRERISFRSLPPGLGSTHTGKFAIVGKSGCGKSTMMAALAQLLSAQNQAGSYGVYIELGDYAQSLASTIKNHIGWQRVPDDQVMVELERLGAVLLLDGLNEVPGSQREQCRNEIKTLMRSYQGGIVVSFPAADRNHYALDCPVYEIFPLTEDQIRSIVTGYFTERAEANRAEWFLDKFSTMGRLSLEFLQLAELPIYLRLLLELASDIQSGNPSIRDLYAQVIEQRFDQLETQEKKGRFPGDIKRECLTDLAVQSLADDYGTKMEKVYARKVFSRKLSNVESSEMLSDIIRSGLLTETDDRIQWFHASMRDYLAGSYLHVLAETTQGLGDLPVAAPQWNGAVAFAVQLATAADAGRTLSDLAKRSTILRAFLRLKPSSEMVRAVIREYQLSGLVGDCSDGSCTKDDLQALQWGDRFLDTYQQILSILEGENPAVAKRLPVPRGLDVFISPSGTFCAMVFSDKVGVRFDNLDLFDAEIQARNAASQSCYGFCLHAHLLPTIDPEVVAFSQVGMWLNLLQQRHSGDDQNWLREAASCGALTPDEWVDWDSTTTSEVANPPGGRPVKTVLTWHDFYVPLTFCVNAQITPSGLSYHASRTGGLSFTNKPSSRISVALLLHASPKSLSIDLGTPVQIPMPPIMLAREYQVEAQKMSWTQGEPLLSLVHLRG